MLAGFLLYPKFTLLDLTGPFEILSRVPAIKAVVVAPTMDSICAENGLRIIPTADFASIEKLDILIVPGGPGVDEAMVDPAILDFVRTHAFKAQWVLGVCTGTLLLGAAGLLRGHRTTGHWQSRDLLSQFGASVCSDRVFVDGALVTSAGVTAGIDAALTLTALIAGEATAKQIQLQIEYLPNPPFDCGSPDTADSSTLETAMQLTAERRQRRQKAVSIAADRLAQEVGNDIRRR